MLSVPHVRPAHQTSGCSALDFPCSLQGGINILASSLCLLLVPLRSGLTHVPFGLVELRYRTMLVILVAQYNYLMHFLSLLPNAQLMEDSP